MNLFLAILLDGVTNELIEGDKINHKASIVSLEKIKENLMKQELMELNEYDMNISRRETFNTYMSYQSDVSEKNTGKTKLNDISKLNNSKCEYSLFTFGKYSYIRIICFKIAFSPTFEAFILLVIFCSSIKMIVDTYLNEEYFFLNLFENFTTGIFVLESLMKIIAKGFVLHEDTYLRESWDQLDFVIVVGMVASYTLEQLNIPFIKVIRILRVMRPLRFISKNANIKIVVVALLESLQGILNVSLIIFMLWIMFASFGVSFYRDRFGYCGDLLNLGVGIDSCPPNKWQVYDFNFDNIYSAMFTLLVVATFDGWIPILGVAVNSNSPEYGPTLNNSRYTSYAYFVLFIIVIPIFFINLFIGVIFYHFVISEKKFKNALLTDSQIRWIQLQKLIITLEPKYAQMKVPSNRFRKFCYKIVNHRYFESLILLAICGSIINMMLIYDDAPTHFTNKITLVDQIFMVIFVCEIILKLFGLGILGYFSQKWNQFDFFIVVFGLTDLLMNNIFSKELLLFQTGPKILRAVRMLRIGRLLRLVKKFDGMLKLLQTLMFSLPMTFNVLALLLLIFFVYTIIGCSLFGDIPIDDYVNFNNFLFGMMTLFKMSTTDNWSSAMLVILKENPYCPLYFVSFIIISQFILTNLFILVLLQQFQDSEQNSKNPLQEFHEHVNKFRNIWIECTAKYKGQKIHKNTLLRFFKLLEPPLGNYLKKDISI